MLDAAKVVAKQLKLSFADLGDWTFGDLTLGLAVLATCQPKPAAPTPTQLDNAFLMRSYHFALASLASYDGLECLKALIDPTPHVLVAVWEAHPCRPAFCAFVDTAQQAVVVAIRGTHAVSDALTDLHTKPQQFLNGHVHYGMYIAAHWVHSAVRIHILDALAKNPTYKLVVCGHSLGAGTAALLTMKLRAEGLAGAECFAYACPACVTRNLAEEARPYVHTFVLRDDIIPRCSFHNLDELRTEMIAERKRLIEGILAHRAYKAGVRLAECSIDAGRQALSVGKSLIGRSARVSKALMARVTAGTASSPASVETEMTVFSSSSGRSEPGDATSPVATTSTSTPSISPHSIASVPLAPSAAQLDAVSPAGPAATTAIGDNLAVTTAVAATATSSDSVVQALASLDLGTSPSSASALEEEFVRDMSTSAGPAPSAFSGVPEAPALPTATSTALPSSGGGGSGASATAPATARMVGSLEVERRAIVLYTPGTVVFLDAPVGGDSFTAAFADFDHPRIARICLSATAVPDHLLDRYLSALAGLIRKQLGLMAVKEQGKYKFIPARQLDTTSAGASPARSPRSRSSSPSTPSGSAPSLAILRKPAPFGQRKTSA